MQDSAKVLVVGTTSDYIDWIRRSCPNDALFLTDPAVRRQAREPSPLPGEEILCDLSDFDGVRQLLQRHLLDQRVRVGGVVSYDCESMALAAVLAEHYALPYPSVQAVENCRNKYLSKTLWQEHRLDTPKVRCIQSAAEAEACFQEMGGRCVLKPLSGSGSELIFRCHSARDCEQSFLKIQQGLRLRQTHRLYRSLGADDSKILAETCAFGNEYSCDFVIEKDRVEVIRLTRKILSPKAPFGTVLAYLLSPSLPDDIEEGNLRHTLWQSATALGLKRAFCMLDFMVQQGRIVLLELSPRPGGDCIPHLLRRCRDLDIVKLFMDFSRQRPFRLFPPPDARAFVGLRLHAHERGILKHIDTRKLENDHRVREIHLIRRPGHVIRMPPDDYDSWLLGHILFEPDGDAEAETQCRELLDKLVVEIV